ncbi:NAD(P)-dependent oxidoreductase [Flavobacterium sp. DG1-102-2]|uniref:NAD-dependent epimerase/dehydratase family protein n=1 Tax=Flavobacterium sp. DG1-102-2 TaxID=3081663 RepID=UPI0029498309|nr:NAD(P)-dependent oxidoreductase [Flavobacterium sp. DG1-102-2]MDV6168391.1 NAD(P)-dependent oxidoreductase [Flavobacterium sp. DG1-102-2]
MVKQKILVTGGGGYIGSRMCQYLAMQGHRITALCHNPPYNELWSSKLEKVVIGDVTDEGLIKELAQDGYDTVIHLVSLDHHQSNGGAPSVVSRINITPVWSFLDIFAKHNLGKFIYFSTMQVYGPVGSGSINESNTPNTKSPYGLTHHIGEIICDYYNRNSEIECITVRLSNSYGAPVFSDNNCWWLVINDLCKMAFTEKKIVLQSDGSPLRDFIHGWDVCAAVQAIIETGEHYSVYNVSSGITLSIMEIAEKVKQAYAKRYKTELQITSQPTAGGKNPEHFKIDNMLIRSIGFEPAWNLERGINDLFDFFEKEPLYNKSLL